MAGHKKKNVKVNYTQKVFFHTKQIEYLFFNCYRHLKVKYYKLKPHSHAGTFNCCRETLEYKYMVTGVIHQATLPSACRKK